MKRKQIKFVVGSVIIVSALAFLAFTGFQDNKAYYQNVSELYASRDAAYDRHLRIEGDVVAGSIDKTKPKETKFVISHTDPKTNVTQTLQVKYVGTDPLPDTFRDYAQAVVEGQYHRDGVFVANSMTAKCASKYEKETAAGIVPTASSEK
jgi:cytochrome c-type biogenesis protein CcmE